MRKLLVALAATAALGAAGGCGDDEEDGAPTATVTVTQTSTSGSETVTAPSGTVTGAANRCADIVITPNSGNGIFDITTENVTCAEAEALLRSSDGLRSWSCRMIAEGEGQKTTSCSKGNRVIVFATEA